MARFTLKGRLQLDGSQWKTGLDQAKSRADVWSRDVAATIRSRLAAAFAVGSLFRAATSSIDRAGQVRDRSRALGIDPELFQQIDFAAAQSGSSVDDAAKAIKRLAVAQIDTIRGSKEMVDSFRAYGITIDDLKSKRPEDLFFEIAQKVEDGVNRANQLGDLQKIMGRSAPNLIPAFETGFARAASDAIRFNTVLSRADVMELARAGDDLLTLDRKASKGIAQTVANAASVSRAEMGFAEQAAAILMDATGTKGNQQKQLEAILELKQAARETAENTKVLNGR